MLATTKKKQKNLKKATVKQNTTEQTTSTIPRPTTDTETRVVRTYIYMLVTPQCPFTLRHSPMKDVVLAKSSQNLAIVGWRINAYNTLRDIASYNYVYH